MWGWHRVPQNNYHIIVLYSLAQEIVITGISYQKAKVKLKPQPGTRLVSQSIVTK